MDTITMYLDGTPVVFAKSEINNADWRSMSPNYSNARIADVDGQKYFVLRRWDVTICDYKYSL